MAAKPAIAEHQSAARKAIREQIFSAKPNSKVIPLANGIKVEVRQPTVGDGLNMALMEDVKARVIRMFTDHIYVPGSDEKVFDVADAEALMELPNGGDYQLLTTTINDLMDLNKAAQVATKNSAPTPVST